MHQMCIEKANFIDVENFGVRKIFNIIIFYIMNLVGYHIEMYLVNKNY